MFGQPAIQQLFVLPGRFAQVFQADHAAAALERMEAAAYHGQGFGVVRVGAAAFGGLAQGGEHFVGFFKEDFQQFGFDGFGQRGEQAFCGDRLRGQGRIGCGNLEI